MYSVPGASLIDLEIRTGSPTKDIAFMFTLRAGGGLVGSLLCGYLCDRLNVDVVLAVVEALGACAIVVAPWWTNLAGLSVFVGLAGTCCSMANVGRFELFG